MRFIIIFITNFPTHVVRRHSHKTCALRGGELAVKFAKILIGCVIVTRRDGVFRFFKSQNFAVFICDVNDPWI